MSGRSKVAQMWANFVPATARPPAGQLCAVGSASLDPVGEPVSIERYSAAPLPSPVQPPAFFDDQVLGSVETRLRVDDFSWPARCGNEILRANVTLPPWIHVETRTRHLGPVRDGEAATVRGRVESARARQSAPSHCRSALRAAPHAERRHRQ